MKAPVIAALLSLASVAPALAGTFVYVSNAEDGDIGMFKLQAEGSLQPGQRFKAEKLVMPMAVSPDKRFLIAAVRSKPFQAYSYSIDKSSGALNLVGTGTLAESYPYTQPWHAPVPPDQRGGRAVPDQPKVLQRKVAV